MRASWYAGWEDSKNEAARRLPNVPVPVDWTVPRDGGPNTATGYCLFFPTRVSLPNRTGADGSFRGVFVLDALLRYPLQDAGSPFPAAQTEGQGQGETDGAETDLEGRDQ